MSEPTRPTSSSERTGGWIAVAIVGMLALLLVPDLLALPARVPRVRTSGNDYVAILADQPLNRSVDYVIGAALDRSARRLTLLVVPADIGTSISRPADELQLSEGAQPALGVGLLRRAVPAAVEQRAYDPVLSDATIGAWRGAGRLTDYPKEVFVVREMSPGDGVWVLCTDGGRSRIYIVPSSDAPRAAVAR